MDIPFWNWWRHEVLQEIFMYDWLYDAALLKMERQKIMKEIEANEKENQ